MEKYTVLIVDDEDGVRRALERSLRGEGYHLLFASGPKEGLETLATTPVDVVVSDHKMPRMTGLEFLTRVAEDYPATQRIMLTGQATLDTVVNAINAGEIYRFLLKPWDDEELRLSIRMAISQLEIVRENARLRALVDEQNRALAAARSEVGLMQVERDERGAVLINDEGTT